MENVSFMSTRFSYRRDTKLFAEIEVVRMENSYYKFIIHPTAQWDKELQAISQIHLDSVSLSDSHAQVEKDYDEQLDCLRAAIRYLSTLGPFRLT